MLDWSWQMSMPGLLALVESVDAFGKEDFLPAATNLLTAART